MANAVDHAEHRASRAKRVWTAPRLKQLRGFEAEGGSFFPGTGEGPGANYYTTSGGVLPF